MSQSERIFHFVTIPFRIQESVGSTPITREMEGVSPPDFFVSILQTCYSKSLLRLLIFIVYVPPLQTAGMPLLPGRIPL